MELTTWHMLGQLLPRSQSSQCGFFLFFLHFSLYLLLTNFTPPTLVSSIIYSSLHVYLFPFKQHPDFLLTPWRKFSLRNVYMLEIIQLLLGFGVCHKSAKYVEMITSRLYILYIQVIQQHLLFSLVLVQDLKTYIMWWWWGGLSSFPKGSVLDNSLLLFDKPQWRQLIEEGIFGTQFQGHRSPLPLWQGTQQQAASMMGNSSWEFTSQLQSRRQRRHKALELQHLPPATHLLQQGHTF